MVAIVASCFQPIITASTLDIFVVVIVTSLVSLNQIGPKRGLNWTCLLCSHRNGTVRFRTFRFLVYISAPPNFWTYYGHTFPFPYEDHPSPYHFFGTDQSGLVRTHIRGSGAFYRSCNECHQDSTKPGVRISQWVWKSGLMISPFLSIF